MTSTPDQQPPPVIVIDGVPRNAAELEAMARGQAAVISDLLEARRGAVIRDRLTGDGAAFLRYSDPGAATVWEVSIQAYRAARLAEALRRGDDAAHAIELAEARNETDRLREDLSLRNLALEDCAAVNARLENELGAARDRIAELEAAGTGKPAREERPPQH